MTKKPSKTAEPVLKHPGAKSVGWALVQAARLHRSRMGDKLASLGLFAGQEQVLQALAVEGMMTMGELASILRVRPPTASKTVSRLAALGLVERQAEPDDARIVRVRLTPEGQAKAVAIETLWDDVEDEMLDGFDPKDRKRLRKLLRKVARNLADATGADARGLESGDDDLDEGAEPKAIDGDARREPGSPELKAAEARPAPALQVVG
jgi:DNA-binding MarR family transcriptional regulator